MRLQASGRAKERVCGWGKYLVTEIVCCCGSSEGAEMTGEVAYVCDEATVKDGW